MRDLNKVPVANPPAYALPAVPTAKKTNGIAWFWGAVAVALAIALAIALAYAIWLKPGSKTGAKCLVKVATPAEVAKHDAWCAAHKGDNPEAGVYCNVTLPRHRQLEKELLELNGKK